MEVAKHAIDDNLWCVELRPALADVAITEEALAAMNLDCTSWVNIETRQAFLRVFVEDRTAAEDLSSRVAAGLADWDALFEGDLPRPAPRSVKRQDWAECWKEHFHTFRASRRIVVKPSWEAYKAEPDDLVVELDPGMCFGTGYHGTTKACLTFLDDLADDLGPVSLLDVGCGSGILSLAAAKLGYQPIEAFDVDENAVRIAQENLAKASLDKIRVRTADMRHFKPRQRYRVVAANVLAHILKKHRSRLLDWVDTDDGPGYLLLAGILSEQYPALKHHFEKGGAEEVRRLCIDEWTSGCFVKNC